MNTKRNEAAQAIADLRKPVEVPRSIPSPESETPWATHSPENYNDDWPVTMWFNTEELS